MLRISNKGKVVIVILAGKRLLTFIKNSFQWNKLENRAYVCREQGIQQTFHEDWLFSCTGNRK